MRSKVECRFKRRHTIVGNASLSIADTGERDSTPFRLKVHGAQLLQVNQVLNQAARKKALAVATGPWNNGLKLWTQGVSGA